MNSVAGDKRSLVLGITCEIRLYVVYDTRKRLVLCLIPELFVRFSQKLQFPLTNCSEGLLADIEGELKVNCEIDLSMELASRIIWHTFLILGASETQWFSNLELPKSQNCDPKFF